MADIVLLNGPAGVGKTTVGRALAACADNGVCIRGDDLAAFIVRRAEGKVAGGLGYKNGATLAANFVEAGYQLVVFEYVFEHPRHVRRFCESLPWAASGTEGAREAAPVHLFTLWASLETVLAREATRPHRERLGERVAACYRSMEPHLPQLGLRIDNSAAPPEAIARHIYDLCRAGAGLLTL